jgi:NADH:ubiquinone oxidoreductase subunit 2 (subunit N)
MTGLPGLNGFWGKFFIFNSIVEYDKEVFSFILIVLTNSIAAFYYIRFIKIIFFENKAKNEGIHNSFTLIESELLLIHSYIYSLLFLLLLYIFFLPEPLYILLEYLILSSTFY